MKHIAVLFEFPTLNGGEHSMLAVLQALGQQTEFRFTALAPPEGLLAERLSQREIPQVPFSVRDESGIRRPTEDLVNHLHQVMHELCPQILHANSLSMSRLVGQMGPEELSAQRTGHLRDIIRLKKRVIQDLNNNDGLVAVSNATRDFHVSQGLNPQRCEVIYNGVDLEEFQPRDRSTLRKQLFPGIPTGATILLNVGQICLRKGQMNLARCVRELLNDRSDVHLVFVGQRHSAKAESVEYEQLIQQEFQDSGRQKYLHMLGHRNDINLLMNAADLLVHTAFQEPFGRVLLEAAASGLPILATDVGGTKEMLNSNEDAMLVAAGDSTVLAQCLKELIDDAPNRISLAKSARAKVASRFSLETATTQLAEFWRSH